MHHKHLASPLNNTHTHTHIHTHHPTFVRHPFLAGFAPQEIFVGEEVQLARERTGDVRLDEVHAVREPRVPQQSSLRGHEVLAQRVREFLGELSARGGVEGAHGQVGHGFVSAVTACRANGPSMLPVLDAEKHLRVQRLCHVLSCAGVCFHTERQDKHKFGHIAHKIQYLVLYNNNKIISWT